MLGNPFTQSHVSAMFYTRHNTRVVPDGGTNAVLNKSRIFFFFFDVNESLCDDGGAVYCRASPQERRSMPRENEKKP